MALALTLGSLSIAVSPAPVEAAPTYCPGSYQPYNYNGWYARCTQGTGYFRAFALCIYWNGWTYANRYAYGKWVSVNEGATGQWSIANCGPNASVWGGGIQ